jgi:hypothetical protein
MLLAVNGFEAFSGELAQAVELQLMGFETRYLTYAGEGCFWTSVRR